jgi:hypothetical protein
MKRILHPLLALAVVSGLVVPTAARAVLITVDFTVLASPFDPVLSGQTANGAFSFNSSLIPAGGGDVGNNTGLGLTAFSLTWNGHSWSTADADALLLSFDAAGSLTEWLVGGAPNGINTIGAGPVPDIGLTAFLPGVIPIPGFAGQFDYTTENSPTYGIFSGRITSWSVATAATPTAEPGTLSLLGLGLLPLGLIRKRRK